MILNGTWGGVGLYNVHFLLSSSLCQYQQLLLDHIALRPQKRGGLFGTETGAVEGWEGVGGGGRGGGGGGRGRESEGLTADTIQKQTGETVDRCQNNGSVQAVSPRHCAATSALRNCCFNCRAGQSHKDNVLLG